MKAGLAELPRSSSDAGAAGHPRKDPLDRLTPFGWRGALVFLFAASLVSFLLCGYFIAYWRNADMDFMVVYSALALNDGAKRAYFDHPAYWTILSVEFWLRLLHQLRILDAWTLSAVPTDGQAFDAAMTQIIRAGRIMAAMTAGACCLGFAVLAKRLVRDRRIATCGVFAFVMSGGVQMHLRILRSEMIAGCFCVIAFMLLIVVARRASVLRPAALAVASLLCMLGLENKVQAILLIAALPALLLPFGGGASASVAFWSGTRGWLAAALAIGVAACAAAAAWPLVTTGLDPVAAAAAGLRPLLLGRFGVYQVGLVGWIFGCMAAFALLWRVSLPETLAATSAVVAGAALGLLALHVQYDAKDAVVVLNPIEKMLQYAQAPGAGGPLDNPVGVLLTGLVGVVRRYTFVLFSSPRPTVFLTWLIIPGIVHVWRRGAHQVAAQATLLLLAAIAIDTLGVRRGLKLEYFVFTDPLIIIAGMLLLDQARDLWFRPWTFTIGATLIALHVVISQAEPVKIALKSKGQDSICEWSPEYLPRLPLPWCASPTATSSAPLRTPTN